MAKASAAGATAEHASALTRRDRSLITIVALIIGGNTEQLPGHLTRGKANGLADTEISEVITHLAFYAGWPNALSAVTVARNGLNA